MTPSRENRIERADRSHESFPIGFAEHGIGGKQYGRPQLERRNSNHDNALHGNELHFNDPFQHVQNNDYPHSPDRHGDGNRDHHEYGDQRKSHGYHKQEDKPEQEHHETHEHQEPQDQQETHEHLHSKQRRRRRHHKRHHGRHSRHHGHHARHHGRHSHHAHHRGHDAHPPENNEHQPNSDQHTPSESPTHSPGDTPSQHPSSSPEHGHHVPMDPSSKHPSKNGFGENLLRALGAPVTRANMAFLDAWRHAEGGSADNPMNTTRKAEGARSINSHGVKRYPSMEAGLHATVETLKLPRYTHIVDALRQGNNPFGAAHAVNHSKWGTHNNFDGAIRRALLAQA